MQLRGRQLIQEEWVWHQNKNVAHRQAELLGKDKTVPGTSLHLIGKTYFRLLRISL